MASLVVATGVRLLGMNALRVNLFKMLLLLVPVEVAMALAWRRTPRGMGASLTSAGLLLAPFLVISFLADVANMQVEEGYSYSLLALSLAILLFQLNRRNRQPLLWGTIFAVSTAGIYLAKSSMIPVVAVLVVSFLWLERRLAPRVLVVVLVLSAPLGWATYQQYASGRFSIGTSIDGINLHKSNSPEFLALYPPAPGQTLDGHDQDLNRGLSFRDEWTFNEYHQKTAIAFLKSHPVETLQGDERKLWVMFVSLRKVGSSESTGRLLLAETAGLVLFRLVLWVAIAGSIFVLVRGQRVCGGSLQVYGLVFLAVVCAVALPYLLGFAYTRHVSVLICPAALMCCRLLQPEASRSPACVVGTI